MNFTDLSLPGKSVVEYSMKSSMIFMPAALQNTARVSVKFAKKAVEKKFIK